MPTVRVMCEDSGENTRLTTEDMVVVEASNDSHYYRFHCPVCDCIELKWCSPRIADLLVSAGVEFMTVDFDSERVSEGMPTVEGRIDLGAAQKFLKDSGPEGIGIIQAAENSR